MPGRLQNSLVASLLVLSVSCNDIQEPLTYISVNDPRLATKRGITCYQTTPFSGVVLSVSETGDTLSMAPYRDGKLHGTVSEKYKNGQLKSIRKYNDGWKEGEHRGWFENGQQKFIYQYRDDEFEGNQKEWMQSGQIFSDLNYEHGHESGKQTVWYDDGKVRSNYIIKNNRRYGLLGTKNCVNTVDSVFTRM